MTKKIISPEEQELFRLSIGEITPLKSDKIERFTEKQAKPYPRKLSMSRDESLNDNSLLDIDVVGHEESLNYRAPGHPDKILSKLRKGAFGIQGELDLHGLTTAAANQELACFISRSQSLGHRCVRIIHGKGYRSADNLPVLKNQINRWLRQHSQVQAFCSAPQRDGGAGAVYVLLKTSSNTQL